MTQRKGSAGGKATALKLKAKAEEAYLSNPNFCKYCGKEIPLDPLKRVAEIRRKQFCNKSCFGSYSNRTRKISITCTICGTTHIFSGPRKGFVCKDCKLAEKQEVQDLRDKITKGEIFEGAKSWQSARGSIQKDARRKFFRSGRKGCEVCGYSNHIEVCYIRPVSDFPLDAPLGEINDLSNLRGLCPNHHWEFDNLGK